MVAMCAGKIIATTIAENAALLKDLLGVCPQPYKPCIPHLVSALLVRLLCCVLLLRQALCICRCSSMTCTPTTAALAFPNQMMRLLQTKETSLRITDLKPSQWLLQVDHVIAKTEV